MIGEEGYIMFMYVWFLFFPYIKWMIGYVSKLEARKLKLEHSDALKNIMNGLGLLDCKSISAHVMPLIGLLHYIVILILY